jgi:hypothetical protein
MKRHDDPRVITLKVYSKNMQSTETVEYEGMHKYKMQNVHFSLFIPNGEKIIDKIK